MIERRIYWLILSCTFVWCLAIFLPPILEQMEYPSNIISHEMYRFFSPICHQLESHSLHLLGYKLAVCARCSAIYFGFMIGVVLSRFFPLRQLQKNNIIWGIAVMPIILDVVFDKTGVLSSSITSRLITGLIFGITLSIILTPILIEAISEIIIKNKIIQGVQHESKT